MGDDLAKTSDGEFLDSLGNDPAPRVFTACQVIPSLVGTLLEKSSRAAASGSLEITASAFILMVFCDLLEQSALVRVDAELLWAKLSLANPARVSGYGYSAVSYSDLVLRIASKWCEIIVSSVWPDSEPTWREFRVGQGKIDDRWNRNLSRIAAFVWNVDREAKVARIPPVERWEHVHQRLADMPPIDCEALKVDVIKEWERAMGHALYEDILKVSRTLPPDMGVRKCIPPVAAKSVSLTDKEENIRQAAAGKLQTGEELAKVAGYQFNSDFRRTLSEMYKRGELAKGPNGRKYRLP
jgi:hypothetical protein